MTSLVIASQWPQAGEALAAQGHQVVPLAPGVPVAVPADARVLLLAPPFQWGGRQAPEPPGWPFGLQWVQLATTGIDFYPPWLLRAPLLTTARGVSADAMAEFVLAAIFAAAKKLPELWIRDRADWQQRVLTPVRGSTLGIYGFGATGRALAERALALGMHVRYVRRSEAADPVPGATRAASLQALAAESDHLVLAAPGTADTFQVLNDAVLAAARPGLHLINIARGSLVDQEALLRALDSGRVALATLDVTDPEPLPAGHPLYRHPAVRLSPHTSPMDPGNPQRLLHKFLANLQRFQAGEPLTDVADLALGY